MKFWPLDILNKNVENNDALKKESVFHLSSLA